MASGFSARYRDPLNCTLMLGASLGPRSLHQPVMWLVAMVTISIPVQLPAPPTPASCPETLQVEMLIIAMPGKTGCTAPGLMFVAAAFELGG